MRTTLDIADDVLFAAKDYARRDKKTLGEVISEWGRAAVKANSKTLKIPSSSSKNASKVDKAFKELGFTPLPARPGRMVTNEEVNRLRDELGI